MKVIPLSFALSAALMAGAAIANTPSAPAQAVLSLIPDAEVTSVEEGPLRGWSTVQFNGDQVAYVLDRNRHVVFGNLVRVADGHSHTIAKLSAGRGEIIAGLPEALRLTYRATNERAAITVFADVSCSFSMHFHRQTAPDLLAQGVTIHFYPAPRGGTASTVWPLMRDLWCSPDPKASFSAYIKNPAQPPPPASPECAFATATIDAATQRLGMRGTPGVFTAEGVDLGGAVPTDRILAALGLERIEVGTATNAIAR